MKVVLVLLILAIIVAEVDAGCGKADGDERKCRTWDNCKWKSGSNKCARKGKDSGMEETAAAYLINMYDEVKEDW